MPTEAAQVETKQVGKRSKKRKILLGIGALLVGCVVLAAAASLLGDDDPADDPAIPTNTLQAAVATAAPEQSDVAQGGDQSSPCLPVDVTESTRTGGWVGDSLNSFTEVWGEPDLVDLFLEFDVEGCNSMLVDEHEGYVTRISLYSPREGDDAGYVERPDDADWTDDEAMAIAEQLIPPDAELGAFEDRDFDLVATGSSELLASTVPNTVYQFVSNSPTYGAFQVWLQKPPDSDKVSWILIQLEVE